MHRIIVMGIFTLAASLFSASLTAGKIEVCEEIKHDPEYKGLYGLCNAYWNADEEDREDILRNFERKAGPDGPPMPGLEDEGYFACPCWREVAFDDVCALGEPFNVSLEGILHFADFLIDPGEEGVTERIFSFNSQSNTCGFSIQDVLDTDPPTIDNKFQIGIEGLGKKEHEQCRSEVTVIATLQSEGLCD